MFRAGHVTLGVITSGGWCCRWGVWWCNGPWVCMGSGPVGLHGRVPELLRALSFSRSTQCPAAVATKDKPRRSQRKTHTHTHTHINNVICVHALICYILMCACLMCVYVYVYLLFVCICNAGNDSREADEMVIQTRNKLTAYTLRICYVSKPQTTNIMNR